jgi:hypothetical protein
MPGPIETPELVALLRKHRDDGLPNTIIAERLGVGETTVRRWCIKHNLAKRPEPTALVGKRRDRKWPDEKTDQLRALRAQGLTFDVIAEQMGISKTSAVGKAAQMHLSKQKAPLPQPPLVQHASTVPIQKRTPVIEKPKAASGPDGWRLLPPGTPKAAQKPAAAHSAPKKGRSSVALEFTSFHCEECARLLFGSPWRIERLMAELV